MYNVKGDASPLPFGNPDHFASYFCKFFVVSGKKDRLQWRPW